MNPLLYISWGNWLGARAGALLEAAVRAAHGDDRCRCFFSRDIREGADWFNLNEKALDAARAAVVLLSSDGLQSHWQAYELGRLRSRCEPCILLLLDVPANTLGSTAYAHLNCSTTTSDVLLKIIRAGADAQGHDEDSNAHLTEQQAVQDFGARLQHLLHAFAQLQQYKAVTGRSRSDRIARNDHLERTVYGLCAAGLNEQEIADKLDAEDIPGAAYIYLFESSPCRAAPRVDGWKDTSRSDR